MMKLTLNAVVATHSRLAQRTPASSILTFVQNATHSTPENRKCWIQQVELINSVKNMVCNTAFKKYYQILKNALSGRFFIPAVFFIFSPICLSEEQPKQSCVSTHFDEKAILDYVIDGDTVVLKDKRRIRLIGINTPELSHDDSPSEAGAVSARNALITMLGKSSFLNLIYEKEHYDRHGRTLAHIYADNINIQNELLKTGLAMPLRIPPNLSFADCYSKSSQSAKDQRLGLWALPRYKTRSVNSLSGNEKGFHFISGKIRKVSTSRSSIWINLENNVALRIKNTDLSYFNKSALLSLKGKTVEANGWLYQHKGQIRMRLRHNLDLKIVNTED